MLGVALFAAYLPTLARGVTFSDGPELVTAVRTLGVGHPTGYPIFILVAHAFCALLPLPILYCVKVEIFNALCGAAGSVIAAMTARAVAQRAGAAPRDAHLGGLAAGLLLGVSPLLWEQVHIPEVYALHLFLVAWAGHAWMRLEASDGRGLEREVVGAALPMGLGLAHHVTMVYMLAAGGVYLLLLRPTFFTAWLTTPSSRLIRLVRPGFRAGAALAPGWGFPAACLVGFLPLLSYGYLIWANSHTTGIPWGDVDGLENLRRHSTGAEYQMFMHSHDVAEHWKRLKLFPGILEMQLLAPGLALLLAGLGVTLLRARRTALFFLVFLLLNVAHGVHYAVGDYGTYYLPGVYACAVFIGPGYAWLSGMARACRPERRASMSLGAVAAALATAAVSVALYARTPHRLPAVLAAHPGWLVGPCAALAFLALAGAIAAGRRSLPGAASVPAWAPGAVLAGALVGAVLPATIARAGEIRGEVLGGESYGAEVAGNLPPGAILMTQGDGFVFTMWYENHVHGRGVDAAVLDLRNLRKPWFQRYVRTHHPLSCDPLALTPAENAARCDTYEKRMRLGDAESWVSMDLVGGRHPSPGVEAAVAPILRGDAGRCAERAYRDAHADGECRCHGYRPGAAGLDGALEEDCVRSAEDRGVVPRDPAEILAQRILEDNLDERPVFERNVLTLWANRKNNPRGWDGPMYQRLSGEYALVNRGRFNEIVHGEDVEGVDPCAGETLRPLRPRARVSPRGGARAQGRHPAYQPNERPTLIAASYLTRTREGRDDDATRAFQPGDAVLARVDWFEKFHWDAGRADHRGSELRHGVRFCVFDPDGHKLATRMARSGPGRNEPVTLLEAAPARAGTYRVQACTTGELGTAELATAEGRACAWLVLDYGFTVSARDER